MERVEQLKAFLLQNPHDSFLNHALALEHVKMGDEESARIIFEDILARDPGYTGSYYHLAKIFERAGRNADAVLWYEKGMESAKKAGDNHAYNELKMAHEELMD
jgi:Tfp pilus assembly protein PilF